MAICSVENCGRRVFAAGMCSTHYIRQLRTGTTDPGPKARAPLEERFWRQVDRRGQNECWPWIGKSRLRGYGYIGRGLRSEGKLLSNRAAWLLTHGSLPDKLVVRHKCHNRLCCNPTHLELGTQADNVADMWERPSTEKRGNAHLSEEDVAAIRNDPRSSRQLAPIYGVHHAHIRSIRRGKSWKGTK